MMFYRKWGDLNQSESQRQCPFNRFIHCVTGNRTAYQFHFNIVPPLTVPEESLYATRPTKNIVGNHENEITDL